MKPALKLLRLHNVDKGMRVDRPDERDQLPLGLRINDRVQHGFFFFLIAPDALKQGRIVVCSFFDRFIDFLRMILKGHSIGLAFLWEDELSCFGEATRIGFLLGIAETCVAMPSASALFIQN